jgi:hypothetical protein
MHIDQRFSPILTSYSPMLAQALLGWPGCYGLNNAAAVGLTASSAASIGCIARRIQLDLVSLLGESWIQSSSTAF